MAAVKKQYFFAFCVLNWVSPTVIQSPGFTNDYKFCISVSKYVSGICAEGFFVYFSWWLKNMKSR